MPVRLKDIAQTLGLDLSTVSRALRDDPRVKEVTRTRVKEQARRMGYQPNLHARALASGRTNTVWMVIPSLENLIERVPAQRLGKVLQKSGIDLHIVQYYYDHDIYSRVLDRLSQGNADGAVIIPGHGRVLPAEKRLIEKEVPLVYLDRVPEGAKAAHVTTENERAVRQLCTALHDRGIEQFYIDFSEINTVEKSRKTAALKWMKEQKVPYGLESQQQRLADGRRIAVLGSVDEVVNSRIAALQLRYPGARFYYGVFEQWLVADPLTRQGVIARQNFIEMADLSAGSLLAQIAREPAETGMIEVPLAELEYRF